MEEIQQLNSNFDTCRHRSDREISKIIRRCSCQGGNYELKGLFCHKRDIFDVKPDICKICDLYESK